MKVNRPITKLTKENLGSIIDKYTTKYELGFTINEVKHILKTNQIEIFKFDLKMFGRTFTYIDSEEIYYHRDIYNILRELI